MEFFGIGSPTADISNDDSRTLLTELLAQLRLRRPLRRVLLIPPDFTRFHSGAGPLTVALYELLHRDAEVIVLPALGTHVAMTAQELTTMFPGIPAEHFRVHDWRNEVVTLGEIPARELAELSDGRVNLSAQVMVNRLLVQEPWDVIFSIGQLVPHEVIGIANHVKNILVGVGGNDLINKSHWLGAVCGMERIMGQARSPVRSLLQRAFDRFLAHLPIVWLLTVRARAADGRLVTRGLYAGDDEACFLRGAELCRTVNLDVLPRAVRKAVVYLDAEEFKSTWLGNKAIYRTRMAMADDGELIILAPGVRHFGEDARVDGLIRRFGYRGTPAILAAVAEYPELANNLSAPAHLIHGSSEGRFRITYCPGHLTREEIESVGFGYGNLTEMSNRYPPNDLRDGWNLHHGEEIFFVSNPALGLWGTADRFGR